jgi:hypothetical protein
MAASNDSAQSTLSARSSAEFGLASLILGGLLAVMAFLTLQINLQMFLIPRNWSVGDLDAIRGVAVVGSFVLAGLTTTSIALGIRSIVLAGKQQQPSALGWAGLLLSTFALLLWIGTLIDLFSVVDMLKHRAPNQILDSIRQALPGINIQ